jgi:fructokinase
MKLLCIGEALIDMICTDRGTPLSNGTHFIKKAGGAPANVAAAFAALGGNVDMAAKVGADPFGQHIINLLQDMGVHTQWMIQDPNHFTTFAFVSLMEDGERDFYFNRGADGTLDMQDLASISLSDYNIVHFGSATCFLPGPLQTTYISLLQKAIQNKCIISFDPNYRHLLFANNTPSFIAQCWPFIEQSHFFKLSDEEALLITGCETLTDAVKVLSNRSTGVFAITLGKEGTLLCKGGQQQLIASIPITPLDATGAGDAFVGAMLYQMHSWSIDTLNACTMEHWGKMTANANKAGARTCEFMGAMEAFKHLNVSIFE